MIGIILTARRARPVRALPLALQVRRRLLQARRWVRQPRPPAAVLRD